MLSRTFTFTNSGSSHFTSKILCPQPMKSIVSHIPQRKSSPTYQTQHPISNEDNFRSSSSNSKTQGKDWMSDENLRYFFNFRTNKKPFLILSRNQEEMGSWQSTEDLKNIEFLRSSTQNPVEKDCFFLSLNDENSLSTKSIGDCEDFFDV